MTPKALSQLDAAVVYAAGSAKKPALDSLKTGTDPSEQPAQYLKNINNVFIFNDQIGENQ